MTDRGDIEEKTMQAHKHARQVIPVQYSISWDFSCSESGETMSMRNQIYKHGTTCAHMYTRVLCNEPLDNVSLCACVCVP